MVSSSSLAVGKTASGHHSVHLGRPQRDKLRDSGSSSARFHQTKTQPLPRRGEISRGGFKEPSLHLNEDDGHSDEDHDFHSGRKSSASQSVSLSHIGISSGRWRKEHMKKKGMQQRPSGRMSGTASEQAKFLKQARTKRPRCEEWLYKLPVFAQCDAEFVEAVVPAMSIEFFQEGQVLIQQGEDTSCLFVVSFGMVEILVEGLKVDDLASAKMIKVEEVGEGAMIGEQSVFGCPLPSPVTVRAQVMTMTKALKRKDFIEVLTQFPKEREIFLEGRERYLKETESDANQDVGAASTWRIPMFQDSDSGFLQLVDLYLVRRTYFPNEVIFLEGTTGDTLILINSGKVIVEVNGRYTADLGEGAMFGELTLLGITPLRTATVKAVGLCHVSVLFRAALREALSEFPKESERFAKLVHTRQAQVGMESKRFELAALRQLEFFKDCSDAFLDVLNPLLEERLYMPGQTVVKENQKSDVVYILGTGKCDCFHEMETSSGETPVASLEEGSVFGEMSALGYADRTSVTVVAKTACFMQLLYRTVLLEALEQCPEEMQLFLNVVERRKADLMQKVATGWQRPALKDYGFFSACSEGFMKAIEDNLSTRLFLPGEKIVCEGDEGDSCFLMQHGEADALKNGALVRSFKPGAVFGEFVMLGLSLKREATIQACTLCLVEQLKRDGLTDALKDFSDEVKIFQDLALARLKDTVPACIQQLPFFIGCDQRFVTLLTMNSHCDVVLPKTWLATEPHLGAKALIILNRGAVDIFKDGFEVSNLQAGDYCGSTVVLGLHRTHPFQYRTRTMCHMVFMDREQLLVAAEQYHAVGPWLQAARKREEHEHHEFCRIIRERVQKVRLQQHLKRHLGRFFPHMRRVFLGVDSHTSRLQSTFKAWKEMCWQKKHQRRANQVLNRSFLGPAAAIKDRTPRRPAYPSPLQMLRRGQRPLQLEGSASDENDESSVENPGGSNRRYIAAKKKIENLMHCTEVPQLYGIRADKWENPTPCDTTPIHMIMPSIAPVPLEVVFSEKHLRDCIKAETFTSPRWGDTFTSPRGCTPIKLPAIEKPPKPEKPSGIRSAKSKTTAAEKAADRTFLYETTPILPKLA